MAWISLFFIIFNLQAAELERFLTKHSSETLRFISMDGRYAYVQKKSGVLGLVSSFRSIDFISDTSSNDFFVKASRFKKRLAIESIPHTHDILSLFKNHKIYVVDYGNSITREIGLGRGSKLHLNDEWITYFDILQKKILVLNLVTQKKFEISLSKKANPFFIPEVEMISSRVVIYSDINEQGYSAMISYNLENSKSSIIYKSSQTATKIELCQQENYIAVGEFPFEGVSRGSKIHRIKVSEVVNLSSYESIYQSTEQDIGNMICLLDSIFFIKTLNHNKSLNLKTTEAVKLDLKTLNLSALSNLKSVTQLVEMDGRVLIPLRAELFVLEGRANLSEDILKATPAKEELQIDL